ncbi:class I SAM-dependent methyltransferase [Sphingobium phenoxybenzoativorans]|uniref:Class I SAM-dependent methyltransferase n=1 Tax=Sphingobium phenoxybenzoativorans TaxID=1592790 RepID=A0A975Q0G6_9SPHN|nr:class I SAM-dependent methyltransferase [Sphingobium phenoxybenzoativorans]QUT04378.1 class I SAM-dependent methyltransferase [Sphingobium phenoxybenzoativorans]
MGEQPSDQATVLAPDVEQIIRPIVQHFSGRPVTPEAVLWPNADDLPHRFRALMNGIDWSRFTAANPLRLLDLGCGPGFLLDYLSHAGLIDKVDYTGIDLSPEILAEAERRWPEQKFLLRDIRKTPFADGVFDYAILCGVFTVRFSLSNDDMRKLMLETLEATWPSVRQGLSYNVMSKHVDWEREDLFHLPCDEAIDIARKNLGTRQVRIMHDYGLYEYACIVSREPLRDGSPLPANWFGAS